MLNNVAQTPGPGPAHRLAATTAPKKRTNGAPVPVTGSSNILNPNAAPTNATANAYRRTTRWSAFPEVGRAESSSTPDDIAMQVYDPAVAPLARPRPE